MSTSPDRLTDAEAAEIAKVIRWHGDCHHAEPDKGYLSLGVENAILRVNDILAARTAALREQVEALIRADERRKALSEAAEDVTYQVRRFEVGCESDAGYYDAHMEISKHLRYLAQQGES